MSYSSYDHRQQQQHTSNAVPDQKINKMVTHVTTSQSGIKVGGTAKTGMQQQQYSTTGEHDESVHAEVVTTSDMDSSIPIQSHAKVQPVQQCIRNGCSNLAMISPAWEDEYCSNECVVNHCGEIFVNWIKNNEQQQQQYSAVN